jgi:hypothetical protein
MPLLWRAPLRPIGRYVQTIWPELLVIQDSARGQVAQTYDCNTIEIIELKKRMIEGAIGQQDGTNQDCRLGTAVTGEPTKFSDILDVGVRQ